MVCIKPKGIGLDAHANDDVMVLDVERGLLLRMNDVRFEEEEAIRKRDAPQRPSSMVLLRLSICILNSMEKNLIGK